MSDLGLTGKDTRPDWLLDPTITEIDEAAIASVGKQVEDQLGLDGVNAFVTRGDAPFSPIPPERDDTPAPIVDEVPAIQITETLLGATESAPAAPADELPASFMVNVPGSAPVEISQEQTLALLQQHNWLSTRSQPVLEAWGNIEQGTHQAIPNGEYAAFEAWRRTGSPASQHNTRPDLNGIDDPDVIEYIQRLEQQGGARPATPSQAAPGQAAPSYDAPGYAPTPAFLIQQQQEEINRQVALRQALDSTRSDYATQYGLSPDQVQRLAHEVARANVIPAITQKYTNVSPTGQVLGQGDPNVILHEAFEHVMATDPTYRAIRDETIYQQRLAKENAANQTVNSKKAVAGSLAHIPSAAVSNTQGNKPVSQMSPQERQQAMIADLSVLMASGEAAQ